MKQAETKTSTVISASAGSGKTYQLAGRFLRILLEPEAGGGRVDPTTVLATTFTRAAAGEILGRVLGWLARAVVDPEKRKQLGQVPGGKGTPTAADCARVLQELAERLHRLQIGTMDGIFARVARSFGSSVGLPPVWSIALPERAARLAEVTVDEVLAGKDGKKVAKAWRVFRLKAPGLGLRAQLMETFEELRLELRGVPEDDRWEAEKGPQRLGVKETESLLIFLSEFIPPQTKNWNGAIIKLQKLLAAPPLLADFLSITLIKYIALELKDFDRQEIPEQFVDVFGPVADRARGELKRLHDLRASGLVAVAKAYDRARSMQSYLSGQYTFREIEAAALQAASGKSSDELYFRLDGRMGHILLDEFQDTSRGQFSFFEPVLKETVAKGGHVLVVGDRKQSIYGWRGSDPRLLRDVLKVLPEAATGTLSESFRSSRAVLQAVDRAFLKLENSELFEKKPEFADAVRHWVENYEKHTASAKSATQSGKVHLWVEQGESASEVRAAVMERIVARAMDHVARQEGTLGILCRTHKLIPRILAGLKKHGIEASGEGGNPLTDSAAVEMVLSLLTWVDHPGHQAARYHVCAGGMADVFGCGQVPGHGKGGEDEIAYLSWFRSEVGEKGLAEVLVKWMRDRRWVEAGTSHDHMRCAQLVELARSFDSGGGGRLAEFVRRVRAERVENPRAARVRVMTIHGAKGLEFDRVILGDLDRGVSAGGHDKPKIRVLDGAVVVLPNQDDAKMLGLETLLDEVKGEEFQEALSVLYVGLTRAKRDLEVVIGGKRRGEPLSLGKIIRSQWGWSDKETSGNVEIELSVSEPWAEPKGKPMPTDSGISQKIGPAPQNGLERLELESPSAREGRGKVKLGQVISEGSGSALERGTRVHAWLSRLEWLDDTKPDPREWVEQLPDLWRGMSHAAANEEAEKVADGVKGELRGVFLKKQWEKKWEGTSRLDVWREKSFAVVWEREGKREVLAGTFDRVVVGRNAQGDAIGAEVVDFKTDRIENETEREKRAEHYRPQLEAYAAAVAKLTGMKPGSVTTQLVWVGAGRVEFKKEFRP